MKNYYNRKESVQEYIQMAKDVNGSELIDRLKEFLPENSKVLEIGSGPGSDWRILSKTFNVVGSDNSLEFLNHLQSNNPNGEFIELDASTLTTNEKFDGIYSNKVLHHLTDDNLNLSIKRQSEILNDKGVICHSFWKGDGDEVFKGLYVNYHNINELERFFSKYFEKLLVISYNEFEDDDSLLYIGRKK